MKPNIRKAKLEDTFDDYGCTYPSFVGKWLCEWKSLQGFGDTIEQSVLNMEKDAELKASYFGINSNDAREWLES